MRILRSGRFFFVAQWVVPALLVVVLLFGRRLTVDIVTGSRTLGSTEPFDGYAAIALVLSIVMVAPVAVATGLLLCVPAVLTVFDVEVRASRRTRLAYTVSLVVFWAAVPPASLGLPRVWDEAGLRGLTVVPLFSGGSELGPGGEVVGVVGFGVAAGAWVASLLFAVLGVVVGRVARPPTADHLAPPTTPRMAPPPGQPWR